MHRNTFFLVSLLAVFAALVVGVNIGRRVAAPASAPQELTAVPPTPSPTPPLETQEYINTACGISLLYPTTLTKLDSASTSAMLINTESSGSAIMITCQKDIPRPPLVASRIETVQIGSVSGKLYHDASAKDGTAIDKLIFRHPKTGLDVFIAGLGPVFQQVITSLKILL